MPLGTHFNRSPGYSILPMPSPQGGVGHRDRPIVAVFSGVVGRLVLNLKVDIQPRNGACADATIFPIFRASRAAAGGQSGGRQGYIRRQRRRRRRRSPPSSALCPQSQAPVCKDRGEPAQPLLGGDQQAGRGWLELPRAWRVDPQSGVRPGIDHRLGPPTPLVLENPVVFVRPAA